MMMMGDLSKASSKGSIKFYGSNPLEFQSNGRKKVSDFSHTPSRSQSRTSTHLSHGSSLGQTRYIEDWINQKSLKRIQENHSIESLESRQLYMTVLRNEENFVHGIEEFLKETELLNLRRKELLYKDWHENVYEPTRRKIQHAIEKGYPLVDEKKRAEYIKYLEYKNKKGDVFLDVMSRKEYDPLCLLHRDSPTNLKVRTPRLQDPLLVQERQRIEEERTISRCETGEILSDDQIRHRWLPPLPLRPLGRHGTTCNTWLEMPLRYIESPDHTRSRQRRKGRNVSKIVFDDFEYDNNNELTKSSLLPPIDTNPGEDDTQADTEEKKSPREEKRVSFSLPNSNEITEPDEEDIMMSKDDEAPRDTEIEA